MKVFISGPMSGKPNFNREAFFKAQEELEKLGYSVWNPAWLAYPSDTEFSKDDMHDIDIEALKHCDVIYMLKGWQDSKGARIEHEIAKKRGLLTMYDDPSYFSTLYKHSIVAKPIDDYIGPNKIDLLEKQCNNLAEDIKGIKGDIEGQDRRLDCHNNRLMSLTERVDTLSKQRAIFTSLKYQSSYRKETSDKINDVNQVVNEVKLDLSSLGDICNNRYASNVNKINKLEKDVKSIKESLRLDSDKNTPAFAFNSFRLNNHADRIDALEDEVEATKESIGTDNLKEQLDKDFDDIYTEFQNTKDKVNDIEFGYIDWSSKMSSAIDEMEKVKDTVKGLNSLVVTLGERNKVLLDKLECIIEENRHYRLSVTEQMGTIRSRLKAIEKRLTEDEKDDD